MDDLVNESWPIKTGDKYSHDCVILEILILASIAKYEELKGIKTDSELRYLAEMRLYTYTVFKLCLAESLVSIFHSFGEFC